MHFCSVYEDKRQHDGKSDQLHIHCRRYLDRNFQSMLKLPSGPCQENLTSLDHLANALLTCTGGSVTITQWRGTDLWCFTNLHQIGYDVVFSEGS